MDTPDKKCHHFQVCRRFKLICKGVKIPELIISNRIENIKRCWFYTNKQFNHLHAIDVATFNLYRSTFGMDKFSRLYFEGSQSEYDQLQVNDLTKLEELKINMEDEVGAKHKIHINLLNVKIVEIDTSSHEIFITAPKLEALSCWDFNVIHLTNADTVKYLETRFYRDTLHVLKNLQFLIIYFIGDDKLPNILSVFPKLRMLSCSGHHGYVPSAIKNLVEYKRNHHLSQPKIYFISVEMDGIEKVNEYNSFRFDFPFQIKNYSSLAETVFKDETICTEIYYSYLMKSMNGNIHNNFFKKYFRTRSICVKEKVADAAHLFGFLKNFEYLTDLSLRSDSLDQSHLNRLDELDQLTILSVGAASTSLDFIGGELSHLNFEFLLKMQRLQYFNAKIDSSNFFDLAIELFSQLKHFRSISFYYKKNYVWIRTKGSSNNYEITCYRYEKGQLDFNGLCREVDTIKRCPPIRE